MPRSRRRAGVRPPGPSTTPRPRSPWGPRAPLRLRSGPPVPCAPRHALRPILRLPNMATVRRRHGVRARALSVAHQDSDRARGLRTEGFRGVDPSPCDPQRSRTDLLDRTRCEVIPLARIELDYAIRRPPGARVSGGPRSELGLEFDSGQAQAGWRGRGRGDLRIASREPRLDGMGAAGGSDPPSPLAAREGLSRLSRPLARGASPHAPPRGLRRRGVPFVG